MSVMEEPSIFGMAQGCPVHGDEHMKECTMCGAEFCRICFPKSAVCPDCSEQDEEEAENPDVEDAANLDEETEGEEETEKDDNAEDLPPGDLTDDDGPRRF